MKFALFDARECFDGVAAASSDVVVDGADQCARDPFAAPLLGHQEADDDPHPFIGEFETLIHALISQLRDRGSRSNLQPTDWNPVGKCDDTVAVIGLCSDRRAQLAGVLFRAKRALLEPLILGANEVPVAAMASVRAALEERGEGVRSGGGEKCVCIDDGEGVHGGRP